MRLKVYYYHIRKWVLIVVAILFSPIFLYLSSRRKKNINLGNSRILVIPNLTRVGDLVCVTPVLRAIKEKYPNCFLAVLVQDKISGIIKNNPRIDEIIRFRSSHLINQTLKTVKRGKFDWSINLQGNPYGSLVSLFGFIPNRVTLTRRKRPLTEIFTDWLNNYKFFYRDHTYLPSFYTKLLESLGIESVEERQEIKEVFSSPAGEEKTANWLKENNIDNNDKLIGISITAGNKIKEWGDENFKKVAEYIVEKYNAKVMFLGSKNDEKRIDSLIEKLVPEPGLKGNSFFKAVDFTLEELPSLIKRLNLYIAVDTGPIYIAHALKVPLIDICGPCDPREQPPLDEQSIQILPEGNLKPSSFVLKRAGKPEEHKQALENTRVERVLEAVDKILTLM